MTGLEKPAFRGSALAGRPFEMYMELFYADKVAQLMSSGVTAVRGEGEAPVGGRAAMEGPLSSAIPRS